MCETIKGIIYNKFIFSFKQKYEKDNNGEKKDFFSKQHC